MEGLVAKTLALREEGLSAWCYTGSYRLPLISVTGDSVKDLMMIEPVIGIGEIALSDHRSSKPADAELARIAGEARVGGMLAGKAGIVNVHLGDAPAGLAALRRVVETGDLPRTQFLPTHCSRNPKLFAEVLEWIREGGNADFTTSSVPAFLDDGEYRAAAALARIRGEGLPFDRVTFSSDGQGSLPRFDGEGKLAGVAVGTCGSLLAALRECLSLGLSLAEALLPVTANPARILGLARKGRLEPGLDADLVLFEPASLSVHTVIGGGRVLVREGRPLVRGTFDSIPEGAG
jgi:beta-aspartyl-dipeptidase (metallo-type)